VIQAGKNRELGLALGGGAARGFAHIGVLEVLGREGFNIDLIAGTSAGAVIGGMYAVGLDAQKIKQIALDIDLADMVKMVDINPLSTGLLAGNRIKRFLKTIIGDAEFKDTRIPFACVATDIDTGEEIVINEGSIVEAIRASISLPGIFKVVKWQGRYLVDGGVVDTVPAEVVREMGANVVIAVNVVPLSVSQRKKARKAPGFFKVLMNTIEIGRLANLQNNLETADVVINVDTGDIGPLDFKHAKRTIEIGFKATEKALPNLKTYL
jgi:NTE family protein